VALKGLYGEISCGLSCVIFPDRSELFTRSKLFGPTVRVESVNLIPSLPHGPQIVNCRRSMV
jgi:hypothetical protein